MPGIPKGQIEKSAKRLLMSQMGDETTDQLFVHYADMERRLCETANDFLRLAGDESAELIEIPPEEKRVRQLKGILSHMLDETLDQYYMKEWALYHDIKPDRVVGFASMDEADFEEHKEGWHSAYADRDESYAEKSVDEIASMHAKNSYGVSLDELTDAMWIENATILERALSGDSISTDDKIFVGLHTADTGLNQAKKLLELE